MVTDPALAQLKLSSLCQVSLWVLISPSESIAPGRAPGGPDLLMPGSLNGGSKLYVLLVSDGSG